MKCCAERRVHCIFNQIYQPIIIKNGNYYSITMVVYLQIGILLFGGQPTKALCMIVVTHPILGVIQTRQLMGTKTQISAMALVHIH